MKLPAGTRASGVLLFFAFFGGAAACSSGAKDEGTATRATSTPLTSIPSAPAPGTPAPVTNNDRIVVNTASQKVCQLSGETDGQTGQPTASQTVSRYGLNVADHGYSFEHNGKLFFLMGDPVPPAPMFRGQPNRQTDPPRSANWNDVIGFTTDTSIDDCLRLDFVTYPSGAYKNPVVMDAQGQPAFTGATNESPEAGISDGGRIYVLFRTDNPSGQLTGANAGFATRTAVGVSEDEGYTWRYLYDFSAGAGAHFMNVAIAKGQDGYLYFWGSGGGEAYRRSAPYLARKRAGTMNTKDGLEYLRELTRDGTPVWTANEKDAIALFHDTGPNFLGGPPITDCVGELSADWNQFLKRWLLLYNCQINTQANPYGIYARVAEKPWGPWSAPQTVLNPVRDKAFCNYVHRAVNAQTAQCDNLSMPARQDDNGATYGPYLISKFTSGDEARSTTTFYHILDTWNPYGQVIMKATISLQR